jgi:hypothetical protein
MPAAASPGLAVECLGVEYEPWFEDREEVGLLMERRLLLDEWRWWGVSRGGARAAAVVENARIERPRTAHDEGRREGMVGELSGKTRGSNPC